MKNQFICIILASMALCAIQAQTAPEAAVPNEVCAEAWNNYKKADTLWKTGWGLFGVGAALVPAGGILYWTSAFGIGSIPPDERDEKAYAGPRAGLSLMGIGAGVLVASVPCLAVGQVRRKAAQNYYQERCSNEPPLTFAIQASSNGIGLAMNF